VRPKGIDEKNKINIAYRGVRDKKYEFEPGVVRNKGVEAQYYRNILRQMPDEFKMGDTFDKLCKMQHYGVPTRLLDFTTNPLVALYFACSESENHKRESKGKVSAVIGRFHESNEIVVQYISLLPDFFSNDPADMNPNNSMAERFCEFAKKRGIYAEDKELIEYSLSCSIIGVNPSVTNPRIRAQQGVFLLFGINGLEKNEAGSSKHQDFLLGESDWYDDSMKMQCVIPPDEKPGILDDLFRIGITEATIYPELEHAAKHLENTLSGSDPNPKHDNLTSGG